MWTAVEEGIVLVVPSTALGKAWAKLTDKDHDVLEVLLRLPVTVVDDLTGTRALRSASRAATSSTRTPCCAPVIAGGRW